MSKKSDITWFVSECSRKAIFSIARNAEEDFQAFLPEADEFIEHLSECKTALNSLWKYLQINNYSLESEHSVFEMLTKSDWDYGRKNMQQGLLAHDYSQFYSYLTDENLLRDFIRFSYQRGYNVVLCSHIEDWVKKYVDVRNEYEKLRKEVEKRTPAEAIKFLETLGFDVSKLKVKTKIVDETLSLNKKLIFVCGDNK